MRILFLSEGDPESAVASFSGTSKSLVDHLRAASHEVITGDIDLYGAARIAAAAPLFSMRRSRWSVRYHSHRWPSLLRSLNAGRRIAAHPEADVILQIGATFSPRRRGGRPYFLYCDSNIKMSMSGASTGFSWAAQLTDSELDAVVERERAVYRDAAGIFTISEYLRNSFIEAFGVDPTRVVAAGAGPNIEWSQVPRTRAPRTASAPPTIVFVGVQFQRKGGDVLLEAFRAARQVVPDARLLIIGPKEDPGGGEGVEWLGFLRKDTPDGWRRIIEAYGSADVFCLPTRYEPFGIAFIEAMMFGLPCVGTNVWAVPEMVRDGKTGFLVPVDDAAALARRLIELLRDRELAARMGQAGRELAERQFTWDATAARMSDYMRRFSRAS